MRIGESFKEWEILEGDMCVTSSNDFDETMRYATQYVEDGDLEIWEVKRTLIAKMKRIDKRQPK